MDSRLLGLRAGLCLPALLALAACDDNKVPTGQLGRGEFAYVCPSGPDSACGTSSSQATTQLPAQVAVGASFAVTYAPTVDNGTGVVQGVSGYTVLPASPEMAGGSGDVMITQRQGFVALLARANGTENVDDYVNLRITPIARVTPDPSSVSLSAGETQTVTLRPLDVQGGDLAGQIGCMWTVTGAAHVATLQPLGQGGAVTIQAAGDGTTTLHAVCGPATADVTVSVSGFAADGGTHD